MNRVPPPIPAAAVLAMLLAACATTPAPVPEGTALQAPAGADAAAAERAGIERLIERGEPSSLAKAVELARSSARLPKDDGAAYAYAAFETVRVVYPMTVVSPSAESPAPQSHPIVSAIGAIRMGKLDAVPAGVPFMDFLVVLSVFRSDSPETARVAVLAAERFRVTGNPSTVVELAMGLVNERKEDFVAADGFFTAAYVVSNECYPALFGSARVRLRIPDAEGALAALALLEPSFGSTLEWRKLEGAALYRASRFEEALPVVTNALTEDPFASDLILMRADMLYRMGLYRQAQPLLDAYANVRPNDRDFLLLRARNYYPGLKKRDEALRTLRKAASLYPGDRDIESELSLVLSAGTQEERAEALVMAARMFATDPANATALSILLDEDVRLRDWASAAARIDRLRAADPSWKDRAQAFAAYHKAGRIAEAAAEAEAWFAEEPGGEGAIAAMARVLVLDRKDRKAAAELISKSLAAGGSPGFRSELLYLQSFLQSGEDATIATLRSSLIENIENLEALTALYDIFYRKGDYKQARFYLKLALSLEPGDTELARRRNELMLKGVALP
ncbi:MAG: tetratricopeptide repeat protein [Spirochaetes bacterium]|nr:tetratricopeptide repeat protein [Spirochaetota bacterium]